jgi:p-aminobenzoyl-glutamate transporter AbgT
MRTLADKQLRLRGSRDEARVLTLDGLLPEPNTLFLWLIVVIVVTVLQVRQNQNIHDGEPGSPSSGTNWTDVTGTDSRR